MRQEQLIAERDEEPRTIDNIYVRDDPYATNTRSLYVYFTTEQPTTVSYTVAAEGYPDFSADAYEGVDGATTEHEFLVLGLLPDVTNTITLTITDETGGTTERVIEREGLGLLGTEEVRLEQPVQPDEGADLSNGLYAILGNDSDDQDFMFYYDANGVLRGEVPILFYRSHRLLFDDDGLMWFSASTEKMAAMDRLGRLVKILDLGDRYILHHDYAFDADQNLVLLATELNRSDGCVQDQIVKLDTDTGKVTPLLDMGDMFPEYKMSTDHAGIDESDLSATGKWDWIHFNTIQMLPDGSALLSARETSTIIKIDDLEGTPTLDYMIGEPSVWAGTPQEDDFLTKVGDFPDTGGQHSITYVDDPALSDGQYYLYMFDNNYGSAQTRPDFDWTVIDGIVTKYSIATEGAYSQYRRYLVDESAGTYTEVNAFDVPYSPLVSSAQELDGGRVLIDSGLQGLFGVYDESTGELLAQYRMKLNTSYIYRVYQYDFKGFYFA